MKYMALLSILKYINEKNLSGEYEENISSYSQKIMILYTYYI